MLTDLKNYLSWLNLKNWFSGINLRVGVLIGLSYLAIIFFLIFCRDLFNIIRAVKTMQKQVMVNLALTMTPLKRKGRGERKQAKLGTAENSWETREKVDYTLRAGRASSFFEACKP